MKPIAGILTKFQVTFADEAFQGTAETPLSMRSGSGLEVGVRVFCMPNVRKHLLHGHVRLNQQLTVMGASRYPRKRKADLPRYAATLIVFQIERNLILVLFLEEMRHILSNGAVL